MISFLTPPLYSQLDRVTARSINDDRSCEKLQSEKINEHFIHSGRNADERKKGMYEHVNAPTSLVLSNFCIAHFNFEGRRILSDLYAKFNSFSFSAKERHKS